MSRQHQRILRQVSRSFGLSIQLLPAALQAPVAIGYLLARATDTVADTSDLPLQMRQTLLSRLADAIALPHAADLEALSSLTHAFSAQQSNPHERQLMLALPACLPLLQGLGQDDQASVRQVLHHITQGQQLDMRRFGAGLHALHTEAELQDYTWLIAGCVGEFWTELCQRHLPGYAQLPQGDMMHLGRQYGMGLQRLNILRDAHDDLAAGRCYWPTELLATAKLSPALLAQAAQNGDPTTLQALAPLYAQWLDHTQAQLTMGLQYAMALKPLRLRLASVLPALIGARTLTLLRQSGPAALTQRVKMPRHEIHQMMLKILLGWGKPASLARLFDQLLGRQ